MKRTATTANTTVGITTGVTNLKSKLMDEKFMNASNSGNFNAENQPKILLRNQNANLRKENLC